MSCATAAASIFLLALSLLAIHAGVYAALPGLYALCAVALYSKPEKF